MKYYNEEEQLYLETDVSSISSGVGMLQVRDKTWFLKDKASDNSALWTIAFTSKSLTSAEAWYNNIEREALGILYRLQKLHHYCFTHEVSMVAEHKSPQDNRPGQQTSC